MIPIKCFSCGFVLADKYRTYCNDVFVAKEQSLEKKDPPHFELKKTIAGEILDKYQIYNICCRRHFLTHVDIN